MIPGDHFRDWMEDFEVDVPEFLLPTGSLTACNRVLPHHEQNAIHNAALCANAGQHDLATVHRSFAGYGPCHD